MFLFVVGIAAAAEFVVVPAEEPLRPRIPTLVYVSSSYGGLTSGQAPSVRVEGGTVRLSDRVTAPGVWPYLVTADGAEAQLVLEVEAFGRGHRSVLEVGVVPEQRFEIPQRTEGIAQGTPIRIELGGLNPPAVGELDVVVSEGTYELVEEAGRPVLVVTPDASPFPRTLSVGLRDRGGASAPVWGEIRLRARPRIPVTAEPGATLDLEVGGREYGPCKADARGVIEARIDQYPGERVARATLQDDLGNTNESTIPLSVSDQSVLIAIEGERRSPSEPPRMVYLHAVDASGRPAKQPPTCRSPAVGTFELVTLEPGSFLLPIEGLFPNERQGVRVDCALDDTGLALRLGGREGAPARISLQVWPTELSTDFPVAEVRVSLEDEVGNRLPVEDVQVGAELGTVELRFEGNAALGEYEGAGAVEAGVDTIEATFAPRAVTGAPSALALVWSAIPESGRARVRVFARDGLARPVRDASLTISAGSDPVDVRTDEQGWAEADVRVPGGTAPVVLSARGDRAVVRELATRASERTTPVATGAASVAVVGCGGMIAAASPTWSSNHDSAGLASGSSPKEPSDTASAGSFRRSSARDATRWPGSRSDSRIVPANPSWTSRCRSSPRRARWARSSRTPMGPGWPSSPPHAAIGRARWRSRCRAAPCVRRQRCPWSHASGASPSGPSWAGSPTSGPCPRPPSGSMPTSACGCSVGRSC